jgi:hypothetical protein
MALSLTKIYYNAECRNLFIAMLNAIILSVVMLSVKAPHKHKYQVAAHPYSKKHGSASSATILVKKINKSFLNNQSIINQLMFCLW